MAKKGSKKIAKYTTDELKAQHFVTVSNKCVEIIDRQLNNLSKMPKGRTFIYTDAQVISLKAYLQNRVMEMISEFDRQTKKDKPKSFDISKAPLVTGELKGE